MRQCKEKYSPVVQGVGRGKAEEGNVNGRKGSRNGEGEVEKVGEGSV